MNIEKVIDIFTRLSSLEPSDVIKFRFMCETATEYLNSHIKQDIDTSGYDGRLCFAAAALAYYRFILWSVTDSNGEEIKIGEVSVKPITDKQITAVEKLCADAFDSIGEILTDDGFVFERI